MKNMRSLRKCIVFFIFCNTVTAIDSENEESTRQGKWFFFPRTLTKIVQQQASFTRVIASSCVVVPKSLSRCRHARELQLSLQRVAATMPDQRIQIESTRVPDMAASATVNPLVGLSSSEDHVPLVEDYDTTNKKETARKGLKFSWAEWLGFEEVTVTKTVVRSITAKYYDPNTVYSFNVKGCRPTMLPFNLPLCDNNTNSSGTNSYSQDVHYAP